METPKEYVQRYYNDYSSGNVDIEVATTGSFLAKNARGKVLDCGSGPVPQLWAIFMPNATEIHAIDLPQESVDFVQDKLRNVDDWIDDFSEYQRTVEKSMGIMPVEYMRTQVQKLKSMQQVDMSASLPFSDRYFDTVLSLYSLGCLKNTEELGRAIENIDRVLTPGGKILHINTNGQNKNDILSAYTWSGLDQSSSEIIALLKDKGYMDVQVDERELSTETTGMYKYSAISLLSATKPV